MPSSLFLPSLQIGHGHHRRYGVSVLYSWGIAHPEQVAPSGILRQRCTSSLEGSGWVTDSGVALTALTPRLISTEKYIRSVNHWPCPLMLGDIKAPLFCHQLWDCDWPLQDISYMSHRAVLWCLLQISDKSNSLSSGPTGRKLGTRKRSFDLINSLNGWFGIQGQNQFRALDYPACR